MQIIKETIFNIHFENGSKIKETLFWRHSKSSTKNIFEWCACSVYKNDGKIQQMFTIFINNNCRMSVDILVEKSSMEQYNFQCNAKLRESRKRKRAYAQNNIGCWMANQEYTYEMEWTMEKNARNKMEHTTSRSRCSENICGKISKQFSFHFYICFFLVACFICYFAHNNNHITAGK